MLRGLKTVSPSKDLQIRRFRLLGKLVPPERYCAYAQYLDRAASVKREWTQADGLPDPGQDGSSAGWVPQRQPAP